MQRLANMTAAFAPSSWWTDRNQQHVREDNACHSPHLLSPPILSSQHVSRPPSFKATQSRSDSVEPTLKKPRLESIVPSSTLSSDTPLSVAPSVLTLAPTPTLPDAPFFAKRDSCTEETAYLATSQPCRSDEHRGLPLHNSPASTAASDSSVMLTCKHASVAGSDQTSAPTTDHLAATVPDPDSEAKAKNRVHDRLEFFLNTKILLKHKELHLIEAETAKCQIALEQLRRCRAIPYPGQPLSKAPINNVITGTGPALETYPGLAKPTHPAPFGVTDGPYSRHYARWLIQHPAFDPSPSRPPRLSTPVQATSGQAVAGRMKRRLDDATTPKPKRASTSMFTQLPAPASMFADGKARLIVKNKQGDWVKLVCKRCGKADTSNIQGFMNHTRIAHQLNYPSHTHVVDDCSQPLESAEKEFADTQAALLLEDDGSSLGQRPPSMVNTPIHYGKAGLSAMLEGSSRQSASARCIQSAMLSKPRPKITISTPQRQLPASAPASALPHVSSITPVSPLPGAAFTPSSLTPGLSRLLQKRGSTVDLQRLVTESKQRIDYNTIQPLVPDSDVTDDSPVAKPQKNTGSAAASRMPARAAVAEPELDGSTMDTPMEDATSSTTTRLMIPNSFSSEASAFVQSARSSFSPAQSSPGLDSAHISPRTVDADPGMVTDNEDEDEYNQASEHGDDGGMEIDSANIRVKSDDCEDLHLNGYHGVEHEADSCGDPTRGNAFFTGFANENMASTEKKKRGRPRKNPEPKAT